MHLCAFMQAQNCSNIPLSWRHPRARSDFLTPEYYQDLGALLEEGRFDLAFFDDRLCMPDTFDDDYKHAVENGVRCVKLDPMTVLTMMAAKTTKLGLGATYSTTYYEPFHVARLFGTLDLMSKGRAAWNIVTSVNDAEARNMGRASAMEHDERYDRADEFLDVVVGHWKSWDDDAIILDKSGNRFADPEKVHQLNHSGKYFSSRGPLTVPRSPQGSPVLIQAGQSGRGLQFCGKWAEMVFTIWPNLKIAQNKYRGIKEEVARNGRDPDAVKVAPLVYPVAAETKAQAEDEYALLNTLPRQIDGLVALSEVLNFDASKKGLDDTFTDAELAGIAGSQAMRDRVVAASGKPNPTLRDFLTFTGRDRVQNPLIGSGKDIADMMEEWFSTPACDGFVIGSAYVPGSLHNFVKFVVPELQKRGIFRKDYTGSTLREHLGISR
ncbi:LLM class flavin-dependent oxidoreductase [Sinorhizobium medicae]|nr:LLM class flavin-dependent oxidoreductase [Sinorhizobium medicae]